MVRGKSLATWLPKALLELGRLQAQRESEDETNLAPDP